MAQQLEEAPATTQPTQRSGSCVRAGTIGGLVGGMLGGMLGCGLGGPIGTHMRGPVATIAMPTTDDLVMSLATGLLFGAVGGALFGAPGGWLVGRIGPRWTAFTAMLLNAAAAAVIAPIEAAHDGILVGIVGFALGMAALTLLSVTLVAFARALVAWRLLRWLLAGWVLVCLGGAVYRHALPAPLFTPSAALPTQPVVQLRCASLPAPLDMVARHCWFAAYDPAERRWHRWEVWQTKGKDHNSWDHLRRDLMHIDAGVGGGPYEVVEEWQDDQARALLNVLAAAPTKYQRRDCYIAWPGPNCNTFVVWVLHEAGVSSDLHPLAVGQHYDGVLRVGVTTSGTGVQIESATVGGRIGLRDGVELHLLTMPFGVDIAAPALTTPLGRSGFPR